jgi:hypothetical protein
MNARATSPVSVKGNEIGEAVPVADENPTTPRLSYCGAVQPVPFVWQGLAITPPRVETHATTHPSVRDTLPGAAASNCRAENAKATPQAKTCRVTKNWNRRKCEVDGIIFIVAEPFIFCSYLEIELP